ncbi:amino acid ABC transporter permease [Acetobacteraceae bacterium H6797]|nr:amino acid ABC transporter permease [Acetobacteraceae bacterium H6797]
MSATQSLPDISGHIIMPRRHYGRWVAVAIILLLVALLVRAFSQGDIDWKVVGQFLTVQSIMTGLVNTILMSFAAMALGIVLGVVAAVMRMSENPVLQGVSLGYAWLFRGTPLILQLLLWFNLALVFPEIGIPGVWSVKTVEVITPAVAAFLGLGINQGAYTSEVIRAGMLSVDNGQYEAAKSIGMTRLTTLRRIVFPQAMRVIIPPVGNEFIGMVKATSLASVIQYSEILHNAQNIYYANSRVIELLMVAAFWYLLIISIMTPLQSLLERRFARGTVTGR